MPDHTLDPSASTVGEAVHEGTLGDLAEGRSGTDEHLLDDLLVEEVSIDGMCGVY
jgi:mycofactocin precursor